MLTVLQLKNFDILKDELFLSNKRKYNCAEAEFLVNKYNLLPELTKLERIVAFKFFLETINNNPLINLVDAFGNIQKIYVPFSVELDVDNLELTESANFIQQMLGEAEYLKEHSSFFLEVNKENIIKLSPQILDFIKRYSVLQKSFLYFEEKNLIDKADSSSIATKLKDLREIICCVPQHEKPSSRIMDISLLSDPRYHEFEDSLLDLEKELTRKQGSAESRVFDYAIQDTAFKELRLNRRITYFMTLSTVLPQLDKLQADRGQMKILDAGSPVESMFVALYLANLGYQVVSFDRDEREPRLARLARYQSFKKEMVRNVEVAQGDLVSTPLGNEKYEAVFCHSVMEDIPDKADYLALKNMADAVKKGGFLALTVDFAQFSKTSGGSIFKGARHYSLSKIFLKIIEPAYSFGFEFDNGIALQLDGSNIDDLPPSKLSRKNYVGANTDVWQFDFQEGLSILDERIYQYTEFALIFRKK
ncbi:MAG: class I SAM-dependent methyltransferase [Proteobacteria bacterium]|nr:class I SAM-dependent methyltransferase [Pseudomonadota bacterium]